MFGVFLCHNSQDKDVIRRLAELLNRNGIETWVDEKDLRAGDTWQRSLFQALLEAPVVIICLGPYGFGPWQDKEVQLMTQRIVDSSAVVIPLILPICEEDPPIPDWIQQVLALTQMVDLRRDETAVDPFFNLLEVIPGYVYKGPCRPSVLLLESGEEPSTRSASEQIARNCQSALIRVRKLDVNATLLRTRLTEALQHTDLLVTLIWPEAFDEHPDDAFERGIADGAAVIAANHDAHVILWRGADLVLPDDPQSRDRCISTSVETWQPAKLSPYIAQKAQDQFDLIRIQADREREVAEQIDATTHDASSPPTKTPRGVIGYPKSGSKFVRRVTKAMLGEVDCDSPPKWDLMFSLLQEDFRAYDAIVVVLTGDDEWLCECTNGLMQLEKDHRNELPPVRAYLHRTEDEDEAELIPVRLANSEEYFGEADVPRLINDIRCAGGSGA